MTARVKDAKYEFEISGTPEQVEKGMTEWMARADTFTAVSRKIREMAADYHIPGAREHAILKLLGDLESLLERKVGLPPEVEL